MGCDMIESEPGWLKELEHVMPQTAAAMLKLRAQSDSLRKGARNNIGEAQFRMHRRASQIDQIFADLSKAFSADLESRSI
jgi:hypothetical protein